LQITRTITLAPKDRLLISNTGFAGGTDLTRETLILTLMMCAFEAVSGKQVQAC